MLSFFRKYEKTFFLIVFLPAIIGMGVTSVIVTVLTQKSENSPGRVFDQPVPLEEWRSIVGPYAKLERRREEANGQDDEFKFYAFTKTAENAGIHVSDAEVAESIITETGRNMASVRVQQRIRAEGIDTNTREGQRLLTTYYIEEMGKARENFSEADYNTFLTMVGITMQEYENHERRTLMVSKLDDIFREAATVSPEEIWKEFRDKNQKREAEVVALDSVSYVPGAGTVPTDDEIKKYYDAHKAFYDEPRRASLEYVAATFDKMKPLLPAPTEAELHGFFDKHTGDYTSYVGTVAVVSSFSDVRQRVLDRFNTQAAKDHAQTLLEQVATKLDAQRKTGKIDMKKAAAEVAAANKNAPLETGTTPLLESDEFYTHALLAGYPAQSWASREPVSATRTSDPLKADKAICILRTADLKEKKVPTFDEVREQVKKDYIAGGEREVKDYYTKNSYRYRTKDTLKFDVAYVTYEDVVKDVAAPSADEAKTFFDNKHAQLWPGKTAAAVGPETIAHAYKLEKAKEKALDALKAVQRKCQENYEGPSKRADLGLAAADAPLWLHHDTGVEVENDLLPRDPRFKTAASAIPIANREEPSFPFDMSDGKGKFFFVLRDHTLQKVPELAEIHGQVAKDVLAARGYERARAAAEKLVVALRDLKGDELAAAMKEKHFTPVKTGFFARNATALPGVPNVGAQVANETFSCEVGGGFERSVPDELAKKIYLVRCAGRQDPADDKLTAADHKSIRKEVLARKRHEYVDQKRNEITLRAKGISTEHVKWDRARRDGPSGRVSSKVRQIYVPNDKATIDAWLDQAATKRSDEALAKLKQGEKWDNVCRTYSEDELSRARGGEMTIARGDLAEGFGSEFESKIFDLAPDSPPIALKSKKGVHIVKVVKAPNVGSPDDPNHGTLRMTIQQILVRTDAKLRNLPQDVADKARSIARKKVDDAKARIEKGEPFGKVAVEVGAEDDGRAHGDSFTVPYLSTTAIQALSQPLETTEIAKVEPFEVKVDGGASEWHLLLNARDPLDREPGFKEGAYAPRIAFECVASSKDTVLAARKELDLWAKNRPDHDPTNPEVVKEWKKIIKKYSTAESGKKEGAFGLVAIDQDLRKYDIAALAVLGTLDAGKRSDVVETKDGFHYIECLSVETKPADDAGRNNEIAEWLLRGTDWADDETP